VTTNITPSKDIPTSTAVAKRSTRRWRVRPAYLFPVVALLLWWAILPLLPSDKIPTPVRVLTYMWDELRFKTVAPDSVYANFGITLLRLLVGTVISMAVGFVVGIAAGRSRLADAFTRDYIVAALTIPGVIVAIIAAMWFGFGFFTPVITVVVTTFAYTATNLREGVRNVPTELTTMARAFQMKRSAILKHVVVPSLTPFLMVSLRYTLSLGWKSLTIAEIFGADEGAGWMLRFWYDANRLYSLIGYTFFFVVVTVLLDRVVFNRLARRVLAWRTDVAGILGQGQKKKAG
jgi:ABC-type nitrate/sulfonate/bicarbonate transport system permease component